LGARGKTEGFKKAGTKFAVIDVFLLKLGGSKDLHKLEVKNAGEKDN
jgi:hypothetical protein